MKIKYDFEVNLEDDSETFTNKDEKVDTGSDVIFDKQENNSESK